MKRVIRLTAILCLVSLLALTLMACSKTTPTQNAAENEKENEEASFEFTKPINLVVVFGPGSTGDIFSRAFAKVAEKYTGQQIIVVNKEGGSGAVGMKCMLSQPADGYTIAYHSNTSPLQWLRANWI